MWTVVLALTLGFMCGRIPGAKRWHSASRILNTLGLFVLLCGMGIELGGNAAVISRLPAIGASAFLLAVLAVSGSVLLILPLLPWFRQRKASMQGDLEE